MATGVKPRDEEIQFTKIDLETIQDAMKQKKFRDMLNEYCEEITDPANQALYQKEMTQLEKERGYDITFINPKGGYVIKTSVAGDRKAFINICSNENVAKPSYKVGVQDGQRGMNWQIPYSIIPPREDYNCAKKEKLIIYDVVYHPDTLRMAHANKQFRDLVNKTAFDGLQKTYNIHLDSNNCRFPKSYYKGMNTPAVIRTEDPDYKPPTDEETKDLSPELIEKLYPQKLYQQNEPETVEEPVKLKPKQKPRKAKPEFLHATENGYTIPKYVIKQQKAVDFQDFTYRKDCKQYSAIPSSIVVEVCLPMLSSTKDCTLDVKEKSLHLKSENPAKYKLNLTLPYSVNDECGNAKFDKSRHMLIVTLPVIRRNETDNNTDNILKVDSGVESEENSGSQSDEDSTKDENKLIVELSSTTDPEPVNKNHVQVNGSDCATEKFLDDTLGYILPSYTHNVLDDVIAFTFHVKNTDPESVKVKSEDNMVYIKFTSVGSGFVPVHYAAKILFDKSVKFENVTGEAWDNNVILQMELMSLVPDNFQIGLSADRMSKGCFDKTHIQKTVKQERVTAQDQIETNEETTDPVVEVTNLGTETNILVSSNDAEYDEDDFSPTPREDYDAVFSEPQSYENGAKSILRKPMKIMRSYSESSAGDIASSMDYISSDCIPEESSFKKTVRFNDQVARQFYRYNSSIEGQKKKNQRKKSKKRNHDRRSESEAEDELINSSMGQKPRLKSVLKQRRDSGLADTSDAETDCKNTVTEYTSYGAEREDSVQEPSSVLNIVNENNNDNKPCEQFIWKSESETENKKVQEKPKNEPITSENIEHRTDLYNPEKLNKGQYLEVKFKNDLIFDLDM